MNNAQGDAQGITPILARHDRIGTTLDSVYKGRDFISQGIARVILFFAGCNFRKIIGIFVARIQFNGGELTFSAVR